MQDSDVEADSHNKEVELLNLRVYNQRLLIYGAIGLFILSVAVLILLLSRAKINDKRRISDMNPNIRGYSGKPQATDESAFHL